MTPVHTITLAQALRFWLKLGFISFGGPAGQISVMHRELVEERRWISEQRFLHALNYCMLLPGPEAQQLATYIGWLLHRTWGGIAAGVLFVLPSLILLIGLSWVYVVYGQVGWVAGVLYGIKPAVAAIVVQALWRIGGKTLRHPAQTPLLWGIALVSFIALYAFSMPFPAVVLTAGLVGWVAVRWVPGQFVRPTAAHPVAAGGQPLGPALIDDQSPLPEHARFGKGRLLRVVLVGALLWLLPMAALVAWQGWQGTLATMATFFSKAALLTFGGAYAVLPYVYQGAVVEHGWLLGPQMIDGLALGETTPGPLIMVVAFVGFLGGWGQQVLGPDHLFLGAALAACMVTWFTFLPSFVFILAGGPLVESTHGKLHFTAPLTAITAAVVGVIASLALFFLRHVLFPEGLDAGFWHALDPLALLMVCAATLALVLGRQGVVRVILLSGLTGWALQALGWVT
jgi:chromate transporter